jgi:hypothetical protein
MSFLQNNAGVNYTLYYNVLEYFRTIMDNHPSIASVSQGDIEDIDNNAYQFYPLGHIMITSANFGEKTTDYGIQIVIADKIKNKNNESEPRTNAMIVPFTDVDDVVDIHANTLAIINDLVSYTQYSLESFQINSEVSNEPFAERFNNGLAGFVSTFTLTTHNDRPRCLYNLYPYNNPAPTTSVYSQVVDFDATPQYNSINYKCDGNFVTACYGINETNLTDLVAMFNSNPPVQNNACFLNYGTYYDNGDGRVRLEITPTAYNELCPSGSLTLEVIYD